jgi:PadR family transcriptional regulator
VDGPSLILDAVCGVSAIRAQIDRAVAVLHFARAFLIPPVLTAYRTWFSLLLLTDRRNTGGIMEQNKNQVLPGTLNLMILKTLETLGPLHGYGIARRIEQISADRFQLNQGTMYPALLHLEQMGWITSKWGVSENNRRAKYYSITRTGRKQLVAEEENWRQISEILTRFLEPSGESL